MKQAGQTSKVRLQVQKHQSLFNFEGFVDFVDTDGGQLNLQTVANGKETCPTERRQYGGIAQLGERLLCKQEVNGSIPFISTTGRGNKNRVRNNGLIAQPVRAHA